jgi:hypothetical protein
MQDAANRVNHTTMVRPQDGLGLGVVLPAARNANGLADRDDVDAHAHEKSAPLVDG